MKPILVLIFMISLIVLIGCKDRQSSTTHNNVTNIEQGNEIIMNTFLAMSTALKNAMQKDGVHGAVQYCNVNALPITDSLANEYNVEIRRTSDQVRNPKNKPTQNELSIFQGYQKQIIAGEKVSPQIYNDLPQTVFYAPIFVNDLCLKCHGNKSDITGYDAIVDLYPDDQATGYIAGDLRGMWSVTFR